MLVRILLLLHYLQSLLQKIAIAMFAILQLIQLREYSHFISFNFQHNF